VCGVCVRARALEGACSQSLPDNRSTNEAAQRKKQGGGRRVHTRSRPPVLRPAYPNPKPAQHRHTTPIAARTKKKKCFAGEYTDLVSVALAYANSCANGCLLRALWGDAAYASSCLANNGSGLSELCLRESEEEGVGVGEPEAADTCSESGSHERGEAGRKEEERGGCSAGAPVWVQLRQEVAARVVAVSRPSAFHAARYSIYTYMYIYEYIYVYSEVAARVVAVSRPSAFHAARCYIRIYTRVYICMYVCMYVWMYVWMYVCVCVCVCVCMCVCVYSKVAARFVADGQCLALPPCMLPDILYIHICAYIYMYIYMYICVYNQKLLRALC
jgi:hypothetical protein